MAQLTNDLSRKYKLDPHVNADHGVDAAVVIYGGSMVGQNSGTNFARQLVAGDVFLGFADARATNVVNTTYPNQTADNNALVGAAGAIRVECRATGVVVVPLAAVAGASSSTAPGTSVYASDGNTLTLTSTSNSRVGTIRSLLFGQLEIYFEGQSEKVLT